MDSKLYLDLINRAQLELVNNPQDCMHEISHHSRVVILARDLIRSEQIEDDIDFRLLEVLCWWHDVKVAAIEYPSDKRVVELTSEYLSKLLPESLREKAVDCILNHEFGSAPNYLEGKILQDADKLEILSEPRVDLVVENILAGKADKEEMLKVLHGIRTFWLPKMPERYHFEFSRTYHMDKLKTFLEHLDAAEAIIRNYF